MSQELNLNELEAAARAYPANITSTVCALIDHIRALEAGKVPEGYRLVRAELRDEMIRMAAPRRCKIGSVCTDCTCAGSDSEANAPGMVADSAGGADKRDARDAERLDWLLWKLPGDAIRHCVGELSDTADRAEFRAAIDAMIWRTGSPDALRPTASPADQVEDAREPWISVDDRLPGEQGFDSSDVLCFINGHCSIHDMECRQGGAWGIRLGFYDADKGAFRVHGRPEYQVTHWAPLPDAPAMSATPPAAEE